MISFIVFFKRLIGGILLQLASAVTAGFSLYVLIASARRTGATTYSSVAADAFGREISVVVSLLTVVLLFMGIIAYMYVDTPLFPSFHSHLCFDFFLFHSYILCIGFFCMTWLEVC